MQSNRYILIYSSVKVLIVATLLTLVAVGLKPKQDYNRRVEKMQNILTSVHIESTTKNAEELFNKYIVNQLVINDKNTTIAGTKAFDIDVEKQSKIDASKRVLPVFICKLDNGEMKYILPVYGKGLWGPIWGFIALNDDKNTIYGTFFDHKSETPGLGAEISTAEFQSHFIGKKLFDEEGKFVSVKTVKGGATKEDLHGVDAISGGTITSNGLSDMLWNGLKPYEAFLKSKN